MTKGGRQQKKPSESINFAVRGKIESLWLEAYEKGEVVFDFTEYPEEQAKDQAHYLFRKLRNFQTVLRRKPLERVGLYEKVQACRLYKYKNGFVRIKRIEVLPKHNPIHNAIMQDRLPIVGKDSGNKSVTNIMRNKFKNSLQADLE